MIRENKPDIPLDQATRDQREPPVVGNEASHPGSSSQGRVRSTYYAPAKRASQEELEKAVDLINQSPIATALFGCATSMMCILNEHRQIVAINAALLAKLELSHTDDVIGLRAGEAVRCVHSNDHHGGCGTGPYCRACNAAVATVASQATGCSIERECSISVVTRKGERRDLLLSLRASPLELQGHRLTVFCMTDIGPLKLLEALEGSILGRLSSLTDALANATQAPNGCNAPNNELDQARELSRQLACEVALQRLLISPDARRPHLIWQTAKVEEIVARLKRFCDAQTYCQLKTLVCDVAPGCPDLITDLSLLEQVITSMLSNAFEATPAGGRVELVVREITDTIQFEIWSDSSIAPPAAARMFHRHFTTKNGLGRGQGSYCMRLVGEELLRGRVWFATHPSEGTSFYLQVPRGPGTLA